MINTDEIRLKHKFNCYFETKSGKELGFFCSRLKNCIRAELINLLVPNLMYNSRILHIIQKSTYRKDKRISMESHDN